MSKCCAIQIWKGKYLFLVEKCFFETSSALDFLKFQVMHFREDSAVCTRNSRLCIGCSGPALTIRPISFQFNLLNDFTRDTSSICCSIKAAKGEPLGSPVSQHLSEGVSQSFKKTLFVTGTQRVHRSTPKHNAQVAVEPALQFLYFVEVHNCGAIDPYETTAE